MGALLASQMFAQDADAGKSLFENNCMVCHNADSDVRKMGPGLKGLFSHDKLNNGEAVNDETVTTFINQGGNGMPGFADLLTDAEKTNLIAYLKTL